MDPRAAFPQALSDALAQGWTVLTGNQRAARTLRNEFDTLQRILGHTFWQPPDILAWDTWLAALWHRLLLDGHASQLLLSATQEHAQWRTVIAADADVSTLRTLDSLAELAASAWSRLHHYRAARLLHATANTTDSRTFARWAREFERRCLLSGFLTEAQLPEAIAAAIVGGQIDLPKTVLLVGFDSMTPANSALLTAIEAAACSVRQVAPLSDGAGSHGAAADSCFLVEAPDANMELLACAGWLRERLSGASDARVAVIVPDIDSERAALDRALRNTLAPEINLVGAPIGLGPFEFSLGISLNQTPVGRVALDLLRWVGSPLPIDRVSGLLLSPHFAADALESEGSPQNEVLARAEFDAFTLRDRRWLEPQVTPEEFASLIARSKQSAQLVSLRRHLRSLVATIRRADVPRDRGYADWAGVFLEILDGAGWAAPASLESTEF